MSQSYQIIYVGGEAEIVEKKSRFIAHVKRTDTVEEAEAFISECKKKYWDARHNCSAFVIGANGQSLRSSDDGEPSGTAGKPILEVLLGEKLCNVTVVVTRYFGGTLLGTGGLVRAYQKATKDAIQNSVIMTKTAGRKLIVRTDYNEIGRINHLLGKMEIAVLDSEYSADVRLTLLVSEEQREALIQEITEATNGKAAITEEGQVFFGSADGKVVVFDE